MAAVIDKARGRSFGRIPKIPTRLVSCCSYSLPIALILGASAFTFSTLVSGYAFTKKELQGVKDIHIAQRVLLELMEAKGLEQFPEKIIPKPALKTHSHPKQTTTEDAHQEPTVSTNTGKAPTTSSEKKYLQSLSY